MKAFVFKATNSFIGRFDVVNIEQIPAALSKFAESHPLSPSDYIECSGKSWTIEGGPDGLTLVEGRTYSQRSTQDKDNNSLGDASSRYNDAYLTERAISCIGNVIKITGIVFGLVLLLIGFICATELGIAAIIGGLVIGSIHGIVIYVIGVLICAQGQILRATLDSAVHSSPFLNDEQRLSIMRLKR